MPNPAEFRIKADHRLKRGRIAQLSDLKSEQVFWALFVCRGRKMSYAKSFADHEYIEDFWPSVEKLVQLGAVSVYDDEVFLHHSIPKSPLHWLARVTP